MNCVVPAKLGDVYRAYLLKINSDASLSRTFGTVFIERVLDLFAIVILGPGGRLLELPRRPAAGVQVVFGIGIGVMVVAGPRAAVPAQLRARASSRALPLPRKRGPRAVRPLRGGRLRGDRLRALPRLLVLTGLIWATEALRLCFVVKALGFPDVQLGHLAARSSWR